MNRYKNGKIFSLFLMCGILGACDKFEAIPLEYKSTPLEEAQEEVLNTIDPAWELELMETNGYVMAFKDKKYDKLFTRTLGWNGGDGVLTTLLPDGNAFWSFNDSFYGVVEGETRARKDCSFPRNSIMVQTPGDEEENLVWLADFVQTTTPEAPRYYQARTHIRHPKASLSDDKIQEGEIDQDWLYWAGDATVCNNKLQVLWNGVDNTNPDALMGHEGICLATYSLEGTPGDDNYMKLISADHHFNDVDIYGYGSTLWEDEDGHIYLYGSYNNYDMIVARTARHDLTSPWEYYVGDEQGNFSWQNTYPTEEEVKRSRIQETDCSMPWVFKKGDTYYMLAQAKWFGREMYIFRSDKPYGPFVDCKRLFGFSDFLDKLGDQTYQNLYMINLHPHLSRNGELVFSTNTDPKNFWDNFNAVGSADYYRPYFYRVYNWERVYEE
ncbi:DUF5005 domain-containing protein [Bacteroides sp.]|uniref:DUF5005 domain-containing protein n=1 Tax=Bacteroides sp. TaxID=29523 RepID=UPI00257F24E1|nr:DUF5005 domain-containing protein [Bacteroides sp.]